APFLCRPRGRRGQRQNLSAQERPRVSAQSSLSFPSGGLGFAPCLFQVGCGRLIGPEPSPRSRHLFDLTSVYHNRGASFCTPPTRRPPRHADLQRPISGRSFQGFDAYQPLRLGRQGGLNLGGRSLPSRFAAARRLAISIAAYMSWSTASGKVISTSPVCARHSS